MLITRNKRLHITLSLIYTLTWLAGCKLLLALANDVPEGTKDKVYSAGVSPNNNCCLMMAHVWPKHVAMTSNVHS
jgi:hypothetical protein